MRSTIEKDEAEECDTCGKSEQYELVNLRSLSDSSGWVCASTTRKEEEEEQRCSRFEGSGRIGKEEVTSS